MSENDLPFFVRFWLAFAMLFRILGDGALARRVKAASVGADIPALPPASAPAEAATATVPAAPRVEPGEPPKNEAALGLLALFQREGRLVDFLQQDIATFSDADIGAAARVVHEGCRRALKAHVELERVRTEPEGSTITLEAGFDARSVKLTGDVRGTAPYRGVLRHSGWRARQMKLPQVVAGYDATVLAPAEVEL